jgi:hypothetical protein
VWIGSAWTLTAWSNDLPSQTHSQTFCFISYGRINIGANTAGVRTAFVEPGLRITRIPAYFYGWFDWVQYPGVVYFSLPGWVVTVPLVTGTAAAWRLDLLARRRERAGCCPKCNYDRRGLPGASVCPECGAVPIPSAITSR